MKEIEMENHKNQIPIENQDSEQEFNDLINMDSDDPNLPDKIV